MMLCTVVFLLGALAIAERLHREWVAAIAEEHAYAMYSLRDELRELAASGEVRANNWVFEYLDSSIAKTIGVLPRLSLPMVIAISAAHKNDERTAVAARFLFQAFDKPENKPLEEIWRRYMVTIGAALMARHTSVRFAVSNGVRMVDAGKWVYRKWERVVEVCTQAPETSTLGEFV